MFIEKGKNEKEKIRQSNLVAPSFAHHDEYRFLYFLQHEKSGKGHSLCKKDALYGIMNMWRKRRFVQSHRIASAWRIWKSLDKRVMPLIEFHSGLKNIKSGK